MEKTEKTEKTELEMEREELNLLVNNGVKFEITAKVIKRKPGIRGFWGEKEIVEETFTFEIHQPTLDTLDRISEVSLKVVMNEDEIKEGDSLINAKRIAKENGVLLARTVAIAVLGEDYYTTEITQIDGSSVRIKRHKNDKKLESLTDLFFHSMTPSKLAEVATVITCISNLSDFLSSMRLLRGARTTQPRKESIE
jgi:hypothetical protein